MSMLQRTAGLITAAVTAGWSAQAWAKEELLGQPTPDGIMLQPGASSLRHQATFFHDWILLPIITAITLLVLGLLIYCMVRFNKRANPTPARWSHNTPIEVIWTLVPVLILAGISIFSFKLLYGMHDMPRPDVTVRATGNQWYWTYEYPDLNVSEYTSLMLPKEQADARGVPHQLAADNPIVVPVHKNVRVLVTAADVIHAWTIPAFGVKVDAVPGRVNQVWFNAEKEGTYYGQCSELCGVDHAFMPIEVRVVSQAAFDQWVASKGGGAAAAAEAAVPATTVAVSPSTGETPSPAVTGPTIPAGPASAPTAPAPAAATAPAAH